MRIFVNKTSDVMSLLLNLESQYGSKIQQKRMLPLIRQTASDDFAQFT